MTQKELESQIKYYQDLYYQGKPEIEDWKFDELWDTLRDEYPNSELLKKVGDEAKISENKVKHKIHMGSQEKVNTFDGLKDWIRLKNIQFPCMVNEKLDGLSCECIYINGVFKQAITRGDGIYGKDITENVRLMDIPLELPDKEVTMSIRGEIILPKSNVSKLVGFDEIKNIRNIAAGIANQKNSTDNLNLLTIVFYDVYSKNSTESQKIIFLQNMGFKTPLFNVLVNSYDELVNVIEEIKNTRDTDKFDWQIDGSVIKQNTIPENADFTKARPDWQRAYKYPVDKFITTLKGVEWSRNGFNFTPVAVLSPVDIYDTTVSRASLANYGEVKRLGIKMPCEVEIAKQNDIIPKIHSVISSPKNAIEVLPPEKCPICGAKLEVTDTYVKCVNELCPTRAEHRIYKWIDTIGALGFGDALIHYLVYDCHIEHINELYCNSVISAAIEKTNLKKNLQKAMADLWARSKNIELYDFIAGFDIDTIGSRVVKLVTDAGFDTLDKIRQVKYEDIINIPGFGEARAKAFIDGIKFMASEIDAVINTNRVTIKTKVTEPQKPAIEDKPKAQYRFCITGALSKPRKEYEALIAAKGHIFTNTVSMHTSFLVNNDINSTSSKNQAAKQFSIPIISEEEFLRIINE